MKPIRRAIDRFCYKRPRFGIPGLIRFIVFGTALVFVFGLMDTTNTLYNLLAFSPNYILEGQVWRLITFVFVPAQNAPIFLFLMLYLSFVLGSYLEQSWGTAKFTIYYLLSVVLFVTAGMLLHIFFPTLLLLSGLCVSSLFVNSYYIHIFMLLAFATLFPDLRFRFMFVLPMQVKWIGLLTLGLLAYNLFNARFFFPFYLLPLVLFLPYLLFCGDTLYRYLGGPSKETTRSTINFKRAAKRVEQERATRSYSRKCAICGKTDADNPEMEFRYCSRCNGYHCYCMDHINNHTHVQ